jgi:hypothetical protein
MVFKLASTIKSFLNYSERYLYITTEILGIVVLFLYVRINVQHKYFLTYLLTPRWRIFFEKLVVTHSVKQQPAFFMETEVSLPRSQKPAIGPYPGTAESSSPHRFLSP